MILTTTEYRAPLTSSKYLIVTERHPDLIFLSVGDIIRIDGITAEHYKTTNKKRERLIPFSMINRYYFEPVEVINDPDSFRCFSIRELIDRTGYIKDKGVHLLELLVKHRTDKKPVWDQKILSLYECYLADSSTIMMMPSLEEIARERMGVSEEVKDKHLWNL